MRIKQYSVLPGFGLTMGYTVLYLGLIVLLPLSALAVASFKLGFGELWQTMANPRTVKAFGLTFSTALYAALINTFFGLIIAWFLTRVTFPGRKIVDALIDLPFALPTAISGIALSAVYAPNGWMGSLLAKVGWQVAYTPAGITVAMILVGLPFVVRTVQPAIEDLDQALEEAALSLGASRRQTFARVIFPMILPSLLTGFTLAFARNLGEYGSVVFIAGNMPMKTEIVSLLIITKLEQYDYAGATAIAIGMLIISFIMLLAINLLQIWSSKRLKDN